MAPDASTLKQKEKEKPAPPDLSALNGYFYEDLAHGMSAIYSRTVTEADVVAFASFSGDTNPLHLSEDFARTSIFEGRIAHGMLTAGFISTAIGTKLPGPGAIYVSQNLRFKGPVRAGDTVTTRVTITGFDQEKSRVIMWCECFIRDTVVLEGDAVVQVPRRHPLND